jgi:GNAT superfamily N-acetyltransferase
VILGQQDSTGVAMTIRLCGNADRATIHTIINSAAEAYRGVIPEDCFHDPYMPWSELDAEIAAQVSFWGCETDGILVGVMGIQPVLDVDLIRHAYVLPARQRGGVGGELIRHLRQISSRRMLVGTWADATWAIAFYLQHAFEQVSNEDKVTLLKKYWTVPDRQIETSVVLVNPSF